MGAKFKKNLVRFEEGMYEFADEHNQRRTARHPGVTAYGPYDPEDHCFYCSKGLSGEAVLYWMGHNGDLHLHPGCFIEMTTRLFRDLHEIELIADYRVLQNASPKPAYPPKPVSNDHWARWRMQVEAGRDRTVTRQ